MKLRRVLAPVVAASMMITGFGAVAAHAEEVVELPREETLYFAGQQWGTVNSWNVMGTNQNNSMTIAGSASGYRTLMFETLYMYNFMSGEMIGLLADGDYAWNDDMTELTVKLKDPLVALYAISLLFSIMMLGAGVPLSV